MNINEIGNIIRERRKFLKITQQELAEHSELSLRSLIYIEKGLGNPTILQLKKLLDILGLSMEIK